MVGMVVTISPSFSLYRIVVFPAASKPTETKQNPLYSTQTDFKQHFQIHFGKIDILFNL